MTRKLEGVICASVTPFDANEELDEACMRNHIEFLIGAGVHGLLFIGGCGEFLNLDDHERQRVMEIAVEQVRQRVPVIIGALSPDTRHVCTVARLAKQAGADAVMVLPPYYATPSLSAIREHYLRVADKGDLSIVVYNNPARTNVNLDVATLLNLAEIERVVAVKDCDRNLVSLSEKLREVGNRIQILSGEDDLAFPTLMLGVKGGIWATTNLFPHIFVTMCQAAMAGNVELARQHHYRLLRFWKACFVANHPAPLKAAMNLASRPVGKARRPLAPLTDEQLESVRLALASVG
jgi:4-hydroxy-tetrahydrodipicolinate synthase